jgi:adenylate cyclase
MDRELSIEELSDRTGEPVEQLRKWRSLGLVGRDSDDCFLAEDLERVGLIQFALRRGIALDAIAKVERENGILGRFVRFLEPPADLTEYSLAEAAEIVGLDPALLRRLRDAVGVGAWQGTVNEDHLETLRHLKTALDVGMPEEAILQIVRVYADSLDRVAEAEGRLFHFYVHERLKAAGVSGEELMRITTEGSDRLTPLIEPIILYFHRLAMQRVVREDMVMHLAEEAGLSESPETLAQMNVAIIFVDLSSFTPFAAAMGDVAAAQVLEHFSALVREAANRWEGRVVKQIGDAFMLAFPDARSAVVCALEIEGRAATEPQFPAVRSGIHWGPVLYREGDYVGTNVNVAARLAAEAQRHEVLVTAAVTDEAEGLPGVEFMPLGKRVLKGLTDEIDVFRAQPSIQLDLAKVIDPVCGMELQSSEITTRLSLEGRELAFCCEKCLRQFIVAPERYSKETAK